MSIMKHLSLQNPYYTGLLKEFSLHLQTLGYDQNTRQSLPTAVREFFYRLEQQGICDVERVTPEVIAGHYEYLSRRPNQKTGGTLSHSSLQHHMWALRCFFNYREEEGSTQSNPFSALHFPAGEQKERQVLTPGEIHQLYQVCETRRDHALLGILYGCGLRKSEAQALNVKDISFRSALLYVRSGKGKKRRVVPLPQRVVADFKSYYYQERIHIKGKKDPGKEQKAFMLNSRGERMQGLSYWRRLKYLGRKAAIESDGKTISPHILRHSVATHLLEGGVSIEQVRDFLGHSHLESTQVYTRVQGETPVSGGADQ